MWWSLMAAVLGVVALGAAAGYFRAGMPVSESVTLGVIAGGQLALPLWYVLFLGAGIDRRCLVCGPGSSLIEAQNLCFAFAGEAGSAARR